MSYPQIPWTVAIFTARESINTLSGCIRAALAACATHDAILDVLVNGNPALAAEAGKAIGELNLSPRHTLRVWSIPFGDKAHAWNEYIDKIWQPSDLTFFVDGYAEVRSDALALISEGMRDNPVALGASGVPSCGPSAGALRAQMLSEGGIHGNLYAIRGDVVQTLRDSMIRLPLGLYRTDPLLGAMLNFRLDPASNSWNPMHIYVHGSATWNVIVTPWWKPSNLKAQFRRKLRQAQGTLENLAAHEHLAVLKRAPADMPNTVNELVNQWLGADTGRARRTFIRAPLSYYAAGKLKEPRDWSNADLRPELVGERVSPGALSAAM